MFHSIFQHHQQLLHTAYHWELSIFFLSLARYLCVSSLSTPTPCVWKKGTYQKPLHYHLAYYLLEIPKSHFKLTGEKNGTTTAVVLRSAWLIFAHIAFTLCECQTFTRYHSTNAEGPCSNTARIPCSCQTAPGRKIRSQRTDRECDIRVSFVLCVRVTVDKHFAEFEFSREKKYGVCDT